MVYDGLAEHEVAICSYSFADDIPRKPYGPDGADLYNPNLPTKMSELDLKNLFSSFGRILSVCVYRDRTIRYVGDYSVFIKCFLMRNCLSNMCFTIGFISFVDKCSSEEAIRQRHLYKVGENVLSVQLKQEYRLENSKNIPSE